MGEKLASLLLLEYTRSWHIMVSNARDAPRISNAARGNKAVQPPEHLAQKQVQEILGLAGLHEPATMALIQHYNHVYRLECQQGVFFLKVHTKDWYPPEDAETGLSVLHEQSAWSVLAAHGLATPEVVLAMTTRNNPVDRPFLLTRKLRGDSLVELLKHAQENELQWVEML
ncbi:MAG TPA: hypothetical protein VE843_17135, partial [Ktedonobacteraceae bacterium]|nr:hypothetical protein [Ktedonobacteraceae bacterium]